MVREQVREVIVRPNRLLGDESTVNFLEMIQCVPGIQNIVFQGPNCPPRELMVGDQPITVSVTVDGIFIEVEDKNVMNDIKMVCKEALTCACAFEFREYIRPSRVSERASWAEKNIGRL